MIAKYNRRFKWLAVPGIALQVCGRAMLRLDVGFYSESTMLVVSGVGTVLLIVALGYFAKAKGHHPAFGLLGLLSIVGVLIMAAMSDKTESHEFGKARKYHI